MLGFTGFLFTMMVTGTRSLSQLIPLLATVCVTYFTNVPEFVVATVGTTLLDVAILALSYHNSVPVPVASYCFDPTFIQYVASLTEGEFGFAFTVMFTGILSLSHETSVVVII